MDKEPFMKNPIPAMLLVVTLTGCAGVPASNGKEERQTDVSWQKTQFNWQSTIDYSTPGKYLQAGRISGLSAENAEKVKKYIGLDETATPKLTIVKAVYRFMLDKGNFSSQAAGGSLIAKRTINQVFQDKALSGCHDYGLVLSSLLRLYGIPAVFVDTALLSWANDYVGGKAAGFDGHIFVEAFVDGKWILLNSTIPQMISEYNPQNPLLGFSLNGSEYFVMFKGIDPWDYGIYGNEDIQSAMRAGAKPMIEQSKRCELPGHSHRL
jgi:hypothetical protein